MTHFVFKVTKLCANAFFFFFFLKKGLGELSMHSSSRFWVLVVGKVVRCVVIRQRYYKAINAWVNGRETRR